MKMITIKGGSDDLVLVDGDIRDEGYCHTCGPGFVELSTGDVFRVEMNDRGVWNVTHPVVSGELSSVDLIEKVEEDDDGYTGHALVTGEIEWVDFWDTWPPRDEDVRERLGDRLDELTGPALRAAYESATGRRR